MSAFGELSVDHRIVEQAIIHLRNTSGLRIKQGSSEPYPTPNCLPQFADIVRQICARTGGQTQYEKIGLELPAIARDLEIHDLDSERLNAGQSVEKFIEDRLKGMTKKGRVPRRGVAGGGPRLFRHQSEPIMFRVQPTA